MGSDRVSKKGVMLGNMLVLATLAHANQFDKGGQPYILHPLKVMHYLKTDDEELQCIALGHDLFEDTDITVEDLRKKGISERVINGILALTRMPGQSYDDYKNGVFGNVDSMKVKCSDLRHNTDIRRLKGVSEKDFERIARYHVFFLEIRQRLDA